MNFEGSWFPHDPAKCLVISVKGEVAYNVACGSGRENSITLAVASATGRVLDPLIIFIGKNFQSTWKGSNALPNTFYAVSESGWMTTEIFAVWFDLFRQHVTERPLLLIFDGHLTHILVAVIEKAIHDGIHIIKLPPHVTDKLQPLDVTCFSPLKGYWEKSLNDFVSSFGASKAMSKSMFIDLLCKIWHKGLTPQI